VYPVPDREGTGRGPRAARGRAEAGFLRRIDGSDRAHRARDRRRDPEALGHADLKTTSIYVQLAREVMKRELQEHAL